MHSTTFKWIKLGLTAILAAGIAVSVTTGNWYLPGAMVIATAALLFTLKRRVTDVTEDERDRKVGGKAALMAMSIYSVAIATIGTTLVAFGKDDFTYYLLGSALLYSTCALVVLYSVLFKIYARKGNQD